MQLDWKRIGMIALFILAILFFGFFLYYFFWSPIFGPITPTEVATTTTGTLPGATTGGVRATTTGAGGLPLSGGSATTTIVAGTGITQPTAGVKQANVLVDAPTLYSSMTNSGKIVYYNASDSKFYGVDASGNISALSSQQFFNVSNAVFDHGGQKAVIQYPDGSNIMFDFSTGKQTTLPSHWQDFGFSPTDQDITFKNLGLDPENRFLVTAKYDGTNVKIIEPIGENADLVKTNWSPNSQVIATYNTGKDAGRSEIFFIGQNNENFKSLTVEGRDFRGLWSPDSARMLYSVYDASNNYAPQLWISDASGDSIGNNRQKISLNTWADRCTFAGNSIAICSAPESLPYGAGLDQQVLTGISDRIWAINLQTGQTVQIPQSNNISSIASVMFSASSPNAIFLTGKNDNKIYKIDLTQ